MKALQFIENRVQKEYKLEKQGKSFDDWTVIRKYRMVPPATEM